MTDSSFSSMSDNEDSSNIDLILKADEYDQSLQVGSSRTRNSINRDRDLAEEHLVADYFRANDDPPKYPDYYFRRRYRMSRKLFLEIVECIETYIQTVHLLLEHFKFFVMRPDATGLMSFTSAIRQLAYDTSPDALDEYLQMGEHTARDCLYHFTKYVIELFMLEFLRKTDFSCTQKLYTSYNAVH
ncbi:hypothetical protein Tco_0831636 [Tanacetum coccineum]